MKKNKNALKKMSETLPTLESTDDVVVYALDETSVSVESNNRLSWSPLGHPHVLQKNASHDGVNIIGATEILKGSHAVVDVYNSEKTITSVETIYFLKYLISINPDKMVYVIWDNAKFHTSKAVREFLQFKDEEISVIYLPRYSPYMNPQENIWNWLKSNLYKPAARKSIDELISDISDIFSELNSNQGRIYSLSYASKFLV
ncbi:IS630 family transposase [Clostridium aciditolerans]|uniref:IS630 family transposase n=2 Tax=Clostridium aciditolerans TaxID=339861 RepID=A0A934HYK5_9CLOT|nr:IS630 family transposase [Clostridium aciditolerans]